MVLSADSRPHFTTIAMFVSGLKDEIASLSSDVLRCASELDLIGKEHFAVDGLVAVVDDRAQIVVHAEAHGSGYEAHLLAPIVEATRRGFAAATSLLGPR